MKKNIFLLLLTLISFKITAQEVTTTLDKIANETCVYVTENKEEFSTLNSQQRLSKLGLKMLSICQKYQDDLKKEGIEIDLTDNDSSEKLGEKVGLTMVKYCPEVLMMLAEDIEEEDEEANFQFMIEGELQSVSGDELSIITLKDISGKMQKFVWLENFSGSEKIINSESINGLKVSVLYENIEIYSPQLKEYIVRKKITKIEYL